MLIDSSMAILFSPSGRLTFVVCLPAVSDHSIEVTRLERDPDGFGMGDSIRGFERAKHIVARFLAM